MGDKYSDSVPTIGTKNIGKQKSQEVESSEELSPTGRAVSNMKKNSSPNRPKNNNQQKS